MCNSNAFVECPDHYLLIASMCPIKQMTYQSCASFFMCTWFNLHFTSSHWHWNHFVPIGAEDLFCFRKAYACGGCSLFCQQVKWFSLVFINTKDIVSVTWDLWWKFHSPHNFLFFGRFLGCKQPTLYQSYRHFPAFVWHEYWFGIVFKCSWVSWWQYLKYYCTIQYICKCGLNSSSLFMEFSWTMNGVKLCQHSW